jgi:toxin ParE1/3/4
MCDYTVARLARRDISAAYRYIAENSLTAADKWLSDLYDRFVLVARNSQMGQSRSDLLPELRAVSHGNYVIFFRTRGGDVQVVRVIHGARDVETVFREGAP